MNNSVRSSGEFIKQFQLKSEQEISKFFVTHKHSSLENVITLKNRIVHFFNTFVWINESKICQWATDNKNQQISKLFQGKAIQRKLIRSENNMVVPKASYIESAKESLHFLYEFIKDPVTVGAILPSSKGLAKEIVSLIPKELSAKPRRILEIGPGTGIFTDKIIQRMNPKDQLDLVEFDVKFCQQLKEKYKHLPNVKVIHLSILDHYVQQDQKYDFLVSGLPLNAFRVDFVKQIFKKIKSLATPNAKLSYFDYMFIPKIKRIFSNSAEKRNLDGILKVKDKFYENQKIKSSCVVLNAPPARVRHHQL